VTTVALGVSRGIRAGGEHWLALDQPLSIVAGATVEALAIGFSGDSRGFRRHRETNIDMTEAACEFGTVQPVVEHNRTGATRFGSVVVQNYLAEVGRLLWRGWGQEELSRGGAAEDK
jgi:hypothetical protein